MTKLTFISNLLRKSSVLSRCLFEKSTIKFRTFLTSVILLFVVGSETAWAVPDYSKNESWNFGTSGNASWTCTGGGSYCGGYGKKNASFSVSKYGISNFEGVNFSNHENVSLTIYVKAGTNSGTNEYTVKLLDKDGNVISGAAYTKTKSNGMGTGTNASSASESSLEFTPTVAFSGYKVEFLQKGFITKTRYVLTYDDKAGGGCDKKVTITKGSPSNGSFSLNKTGAQETCSGLTVNVTDITPASGYKFSAITQSGVAAGNVTIDQSAKTVTYANNTTGTSTINVTFEAKNCTDHGASSITGGTSTGYIYGPVSNYYNYSARQILYTKSDLGLAAGKKGTIKSIYFQYAYATAMTKKTSVKIYMANTDITELSTSSYVPFASFTEVYDGSLNCSGNGTWNEIFLSSNFEYDGAGNLAVLIDDNSGVYDGSSYIFKYHDSGADGIQLYYNIDGINPDPSVASTWTSATATSNRPNTKFCIQEADMVPATVTLKDNDATLTEASAGAGVTLPSRTGCSGYTFAGWTKSWTEEQDEWTTTAPTIIPAGSYTPSADENLYPVYTKTEGEEEEETEIFATTSLGSTNTVTTGYAVSAAAEAKSGYYQDGSGTTRSVSVSKSSTATAMISSIPTIATVTATLGGGSTKDPLTNNVYAVWLDASGNELGDAVQITSKITNTTGSDFTANLPVANATSAYGVRIKHQKETSYNVRYYAISLSITTGGSTTYYISVPNCCSSAAVVTVSPTSPTLALDIDGNASTTVSVSQTGGGSGRYYEPTITPAVGASTNWEGSYKTAPYSVTFTATATGTYTVVADFRETAAACSKYGSADITVAANPILTPSSDNIAIDATCGTSSSATDITVNSRYLAGSSITASIAKSSGSGTFTISSDNSTFNTSNKTIDGGTSDKVTSHIYVRYEAVADEVGSAAGTLTLTCGAKVVEIPVSATVSCSAHVDLSSAAPIQITAANGIWVEAANAVTVTGSYLTTNSGPNSNVSIRAYTNNANFQIKRGGTTGEGAAKTSQGTSLSLVTNHSSADWSGSIGIVYKPAVHNTTESATLTVEVFKANGSTIYDTKTYTLYGRSLPENFVIAVTDGSGNWYAVPADMIAPWGSSCLALGTYKPYPIMVNNTTTPSALSSSAPVRAVYTAAARTGAVNTNPQTLSFKSVPLAGSGNYYLYGSSGSETTIQNASNNTSEQQKWFLDVVDWTSKEYNMHLHTDQNTRVLAYSTAGGTNSVGEYADASTTKKSVYILPVSTTCTNHFAPEGITCQGIDATNYTIRFTPDRTKNYEVSLNGSSWSDVTTSVVTRCNDNDAYPKLVEAQIPLATYHGQTVYIRVKDGSGCPTSTTFDVPDPSITVNSGTWTSMSGIAGSAFENTSNTISITKASCGDQTVGVTCSNSKISASVNQSTGVVTISMTAGNATAGTHTGTLTFTLTGGTTRTQNISITLQTLAAQSFTANPSYFSDDVLCNNTGDFSSSSVYPFVLTYQCFNSDGTTATIGNFNSTDTKVTDLTTGADLTGSVTRGFNSAGTNIRYALNNQYSQFIPGHKYRISWINTGQVMCNSSGIPYQDCHYDFVFSTNCAKPTALTACPIYTTSFVANWIDNTCSATNSTVTVYTKASSTLVDDDFTSSFTGTAATTFNQRKDGKYCSNNTTNALSRSDTYGFSMNYCIYSPILGTWKADLTTTDELTITVDASNKVSSSQTLTIYVIASANVAASNSPTAKSVTINGSSASSISTSSIASNGTGSVTFTLKGVETTDRLFFKQSGASSNFYLSALTIKSVANSTVKTATPKCTDGHVTITGLSSNTQYYYTVTNSGNTSNEIAVKTRSGAPLIYFEDGGSTITSYTFDETAIGESTSKTFDVTASRATICDLKDLITALGGTDAGMFSVSVDFSTWDIYPDLGTYSGDITITYEPSSPGTHTATYTITDNGTSSTLTLNGTATGGQIEVVQWATHGLIVESYVIASGTPQVDSYVGESKSNGTYEISDDGWDIDALANDEITVEWGAVSQTFRVPIIVNSTKNSSTLSSATSESTIVVGPEGVLHINDDLTCHGLELYPQAKVDFSSGSLTAKYVRLYCNGDTWTLFPSFDASGASSISVDNAYVDFRIDESRFHFITLPFDVQTGDVVYAAPAANGEYAPALRNSANNTAFYVRQYNGIARETNNKSTEETYNTNMPHIGTRGGNYTMIAGRGYMIGIGDQATATGHAKRTLRFPVAMNSTKWTAEKGSSKVVGGSWVADGTDNGSASAVNKGWNLVGNPFMRELAVSSSSAGIATGQLDDSGGSWAITGSARYITIYNAATDAFTYQSIASSFTLKPMAAFYIQMKNAKYIHFQTAMTGEASAPSRMLAEEPQEEEVNVVLSMANEGQVDKAGVVLHSKYDAAYNETDDADYPKLMSGTQLALWSIAGEEKLASNGLPKDAPTDIPLGYQAPQAGEYVLTIDLEESNMKWLRHVWLTDLAQNKICDLLIEPYKFTLTEGEKRGDRFLLGIELFSEEEVTTGIDGYGEPAMSDRPTKFIYKDKLYIQRGGMIYDATGKRVSVINK